jgi:hypothetical protein
VPEQYVRVAAAGTPATIFEAKWEKRAEDLSFEALGSVRTIAEKWTATIATLLAILQHRRTRQGPATVAVSDVRAVGAIAACPGE